MIKRHIWTIWTPMSSVLKKVDKLNLSLSLWPAPSHYLNLCWNIVNQTIRKKLQWNLNEIHTFSLKKIHCKMSSGKWRPFCLGLNVLINSSPMDKMTTILADNFKCIFLNENDRIPISMSLKFVPRSPIDNKPALAQVMAWRWAGDKPLPELMLTQVTDAYIWH